MSHEYDEKPDALTGIFDDLKPEDFTVRRTTAIDEAAPESTDFDRFVDEQLRAVRYAFAAADGAINPMATLANAHTERVFAPEDDESLGEYIDRLNREARVLDATRVFIFKRTIVGVVTAETPFAVDDPKEFARVNNPKEAVYWYAEQIVEPRRRHGYLEIVEKHLGDLYEGRASQAVHSFGRILERTTSV